jgi:oligoendopeptidase F
MATAEAQTPEFMSWTWEDIEPQFDELQERELASENVEQFLRDWTDVASRVYELGTRLEVATTLDTSDEEASKKFRSFVHDVKPRVSEREQGLKEKLLASELVPRGMEMPIRLIRQEAQLFRAENLPLLSQEQILFEDYFKITGAQTVEWDGEEIPVVKLQPVYEEQDRDRRERAYRLATSRRQQDAAAIDEVWRKLLEVREKISTNAGFSGYRDYRWLAMGRFDYTVEDAKQFQASVEAVVVPAATRLAEKRAGRLGVATVRPWDRYVDPLGRPPLKPYREMSDFLQRLSTVFHRVDPKVGEYFDTMRSESLLDLESRKNKAPGGYCTLFYAAGRPFIFGNCVGSHADIQLLLHEGGHAFHCFQTTHLPYIQQRSIGAIPMEFAEVASTAMELLAGPYLPADSGGFYSPADAARARHDHLESQLISWTWIAAIDSFQHWIYEHMDESADAERMGDVWAETIRRYMPFVDYSGLESELRNDWRRVLHLFAAPFYYIEYGLAAIGAVQVWGNSLQDQSAAVEKYLYALSLGGTRPLPELFAAAGASFRFDESTFTRLTELMEAEMAHLEVEAASP